VAKQYGVPMRGPFFLPATALAGTFGAVVVKRGPYPSRRALFDIAIAGPLAGFLVLVPITILGLALSIPATPSDVLSPRFQAPLLFRLFGSESLVYHPVLTAAWWGCLLTAINGLPLWPFDGWRAISAAYLDPVTVERHPLDRSRRWLLVPMGVLCLLCWPAF
jgi:membrane-associated protease RseP (regulator of RpoE activity)